MDLKFDKEKLYCVADISSDQWEVVKTYLNSIDNYSWVDTTYNNAMHEDGYIQYDEVYKTWMWDDNPCEKEVISVKSLLTPPTITRFEYITKEGRQIVEYGEFTFQLQDDKRTLKVFKE